MIPMNARYGINSDLILGSRRKPSTDRGRDESSSFGRYELRYMWNGSTCQEPLSVEELEVA